MQAEIELGCKITELEEIVAGLRLEREKLYQALNRQIEAGAFEARQLKYQIAYLTEDRDNWKDKAVEISHALTYAPSARTTKVCGWCVTLKLMARCRRCSQKMNGANK